MNYAEVIDDIKKLQGLRLNSIRAGAEIRIIEVDEEKGSLIIENNKGVHRSRPLSEIQTIWNEMTKSAAVHVEGVLHGSGTSRNQPETILANLPYVEWLKVDNKKHIAFVGCKTHAYGTLKQMDSMQAMKIKSKLEAHDGKKTYSTVIVSKDLNESVKILNSICPGKLSAISQGLYRYETKADYILMLSEGENDLEEGTYCVIETFSVPKNSNRVRVDDQDYYVVNEKWLKAFLKYMK